MVHMVGGLLGNESSRCMNTHRLMSTLAKSNLRWIKRTHNKGERVDRLDAAARHVCTTFYSV